MTESPAAIPAATRSGLATQLATVAGAAAVAWMATADRPGRGLAVGFAAAVCLVGILGGWVAGRRPGTTPAARVSAALAVVALRIFPALAALAWLQTPAAAGFREAGADGILVGLYLAVLAVDLILNIMGTRRPGPRPGTTRAN
jgi:hypothetical protein